MEAGRQEIQLPALLAYVERHRRELLLPDQDVLNALYGQRILPVDGARRNYDARNDRNYLLRSGGMCDLRWVMEHAAILHFCGKEKPCKPKYRHRFALLCLHYAQLVERQPGGAPERCSSAGYPRRRGLWPEDIPAHRWNSGHLPGRNLCGRSSRDRETVSVIPPVPCVHTFLCKTMPQRKSAGAYSIPKSHSTGTSSTLAKIGIS